jgi:adenylate cyclase class 2
MYEIETKVLEVDVEEISEKIEDLGAKKIHEVILKVDWFSLPGVAKDKQPWYLRVRSYSDGKVEVTWKDEPKLIGNLRKGAEINVLIDNHEKMKMLFESIGLICYAHQEKKRVSWVLDNVQFDLDTYPNMPSFLEIEVENEKDIDEMIEKLDLKEHDTWNDGERTLIERKYNLNWSDMRF